MSLRAGGNITPEAAKLFEEALALEPTSPKALLYGGFAAAARGDITAARNRWLVLKEMHPPAQIEQLLDARIAELGPAAAGNSPQQAGNSPAQPGISAEQTGNSPGQAASDAEVSVNIRIAPAIKARLIREVPLFVFAREQGVQGPPLAAKRLTSAAIGTQIHLSAADSMMPGRVLTKGRRVSVTARVSFSGQPLPAAGDLYGELTYDVGQDGTRDLLIDRIAD
jgi:cytochrome c-type biogenesis protein CcmH